MILDPFNVSSMGLQEGGEIQGFTQKQGASFEISHTGAKTEPRSFQ